MNEKCELFLDKYRQLEALIALEYHLSSTESPIAFLMRRPEQQAIRSELDYCREVRNLLSHNPKVEGSFLVEPSDAMLELLEGLLQRIRSPKRARDIWVPRERVVCRTMNDYVLPALREMSSRGHSHIPILRNGVVVGVFSENTLLKLLIDGESHAIGPKLRFRDIEGYLPLQPGRSERYPIVSQNMPVEKLSALFARTPKESRRIGLVFITARGHANEKLLGILSAWDMAGID